MEEYLKALFNIAKENNDYEPIERFIRRVEGIETQAKLNSAARINFDRFKNELISYGIDLESNDESNPEGRRGVHYAAYYNDPAAMEILSKADPGPQDAAGWTAVHYTAQMGSAEALKTLLRHADDTVDMTNHEGRTGLHVALEFGFVEVVRVLLEANASPQIKDIEGETAIDILFDQAPQYEPQVLQYLIRELAVAGADPMKRDACGRTALHRAATNEFYEKNTDYIVAIIRGGVDLSAVDEKGNTALHYTMGYRLWEITRSLWNLHSNPVALNKEGVTPWELIEEWAWEDPKVEAQFYYEIKPEF
jgi:ankyrin repeat protein